LPTSYSQPGKGFSIGFKASSRLKAASSNLISAREHTEVVSAYIQDELSHVQLSHVGPYTEHAAEFPTGYPPKRQAWQMVFYHRSLLPRRI